MTWWYIVPMTLIRCDRSTVRSDVLVGYVLILHDKIIAAAGDQGMSCSVAGTIVPRPHIAS